MGIIIDGYPAAAIIDWAHYMVHQWKYFNVATFETATLAATPTLFHLAVGSEPLHFIFHVHTVGAAEIRLYEGPTITGAGTPITVQPNNRKPITPAKTPPFTFAQDPTVSANGTEIWAQRIGFSGASFFVGSADGAVRPGAEKILAPNTDYLFEFDVASDGVVVNIEAEGYTDD